MVGSTDARGTRPSCVLGPTPHRLCDGAVGRSRRAVGPLAAVAGRAVVVHVQLFEACRSASLLTHEGEDSGPEDEETEYGILNKLKTDLSSRNGGSFRKYERTVRITKLVEKDAFLILYIVLSIDRQCLKSV